MLAKHLLWVCIQSLITQRFLWGVGLVCVLLVSPVIYSQDDDYSYNNYNYNNNDYDYNDDNNVDSNSSESDSDNDNNYYNSAETDYAKSSNTNYDATDNLSSNSEENRATADNAYGNSPDMFDNDSGEMESDDFSANPDISYDSEDNSNFTEYSQLKLEPIPLPNEFSGAPSVLGTLGILDVGEAPSYYTIQEGDTLFDICDQLLDDPAYWPKLWSLNPEIRNPHFIWPGMVLRFYPGDDFLPPFLEIEDDENLYPVNMAEDYVVEDLLFVDLFDVPPPPPLKSALFQRIVEWDDVESLDSDRIQVYGGYGNQTIKARQPFFVYEDRIDPLATVEGKFDATNLMNQAGIVETEEPLDVGKTYSVLRYEGKVRNIRGGILGSRYLNVGVIRVDDYSAEESKAVFTSLDQWINFAPDDLVVEYIPTMHNIPFLSGVQGRDADTTVVGFRYEVQTLSAENGFVILDSNDLNKGERVALYRRRATVNSPEGKYLEGYGGVVRYGTAQVVDVGDVVSIAYVVQSNFIVQIGDRTDENFE